MRLAAAGAMLVATAACSGDRAPTSSRLTVPEGTSRYIAVDQEIDQSDSYVIADASVETSTTLTYDQAVPHPETGEMVTSITTNTPAEQVGVHTGYDSYGRTRTSTYFGADPDPAADPGEQTATVRTINDDQYTWNMHGQMVGMEADDPHITDVTGTLVDAPVTEGLVTGDPRSVDIVAFFSISPAVGGGRVPAAARQQVEQLGPNRVRVSIAGVDVSLRAGENRNGAAVGRGTGRGKIARTFRRDRDAWVLEELRIEGEEATEGRGRAVHTQTMRFKNVRWNRNPAKDAARSRRRAERARNGTTAPAPSRSPSAVVSPVDCPPDNYTTDPDCDMGGGGGGGGGDTGSTVYTGSVGSSSAEGDAAMEWRLPYQGASTGTRIVVQHGFADNGDSYRQGRVGDALRSFYYDQLIFPTTSWSQTYEAQAQQLRASVEGFRNGDGGKYVFVGYSNGGILSRQVGQSNPDLMRGVISVSTPHRGVPVMRLGRPALNTMMTFAAVGLLASCQVRNHSGCNTQQALATLSGRYGIDAMWPVAHQMVPGSAYLQTLNSASEGWRKISMEQHTSQRWAFWRVYKDLNCYGPEAPCGGRDAVRKLDKTYKNLIAQTVVTGILGFVIQGLHTYTVIYGMAVAGLNAMDWIWDAVTSPGDGSDGVVPNRSQEYPGANRREIITNADSHDAAKKSVDKAISRLKQVLRDERWAGS
ncbi:MAG TPA: alpha/beta hydrolase [Longimicrobium sp.]|jgi:pimeloyl-ACP methyl ester carboxylesterase